MNHENSYKIFNLYYRSKKVGFQTCPLALFFELNDGHGVKKFEIFRFLQAETKTPEMEEIAPTEPYEAHASDDDYRGYVEKLFGAPRPKYVSVPNREESFLKCFDELRKLHLLVFMIPGQQITTHR